MCEWACVMHNMYMWVRGSLDVMDSSVIKTPSSCSLNEFAALSTCSISMSF